MSSDEPEYESSSLRSLLSLSSSRWIGGRRHRLHRLHRRRRHHCTSGRVFLLVSSLIQSLFLPRFLLSSEFDCSNYESGESQENGGVPSLRDLRDLRECLVRTVEYNVQPKTVSRMATYARPGWRRILIDSGAQCHVCPVSFASNFTVNYNRRVLLRGAGNHVIKHHGESCEVFCCE